MAPITLITNLEQLTIQFRNSTQTPILCFQVMPGTDPILFFQLYWLLYISCSSQQEFLNIQNSGPVLFYAYFLCLYFNLPQGLWLFKYYPCFRIQLNCLFQSQDNTVYLPVFPHCYLAKNRCLSRDLNCWIEVNPGLNDTKLVFLHYTTLPE